MTPLEAANELAEQLRKDGRPIEAGFVEACKILSDDITDATIAEVRMAFFAGALHLMYILHDHAKDDAETYFAFTRAVRDELDAFSERVIAEHFTAGHA